MRTSNPALNQDAFLKEKRISGVISSDVMTINGTINRIALLLLIVMVSSYWTWTQSYPDVPYGAQPIFTPSPLLWLGLIGGFILSLITIFKKSWSPITAPLYALFEGLALGAISAGFELLYPGIVFQAIFGTFGTLIALLIAYRSGLIKVTEKFKLGIVAATGGIAIVYLVSIVLGFFGMNLPFLYSSSPISIGFSAVVIIIAALNLVLDFDLIETGAKVGAPKYMEWYGAFALMLTLVWLYLEILRLISKIRSR